MHSLADKSKIIHKVNKMSRKHCELFIKFACVGKAVASVKGRNIRAVMHGYCVQQSAVRLAAKANDRLTGADGRSLSAEQSVPE